MSNATFAFKQFVIKQEHSAMKVNTDAVLLGSWTQPHQSKNILDIGTGTGVIALMLAQKSNAQLTAIDIDKQSADEALFNVNQSIFKERIAVKNISLQLFGQSKSDSFDLIVTNPPYFVGSLPSSDTNRTNARHTSSLSFEDLIIGVKQLLTSKGKFCLILPKNEALLFREMAETQGFHLSKLLRVRTRADKDSEKRQLMQFEFTPTDFSEETLVIEQGGRHEFSEEYKNLTKDFYLHF
jgi:tRNA1Val (adenine37-N6)-methyltransferase